jgi:hypothetical protein
VGLDHEWEANPASRVGSRSGCPYCSGKKVSLTKSLAILAPDVAVQWHPLRNGILSPADVTLGTGAKYWWLCDVGLDHEWEASPSSRVDSRSGCLYCSGKKVSITNSLAILAPEVAAQWHPTRNCNVTPDGVTSKANKKYWWQCDVGPDHEWEASPAGRVKGGRGCPCCSGHKVSVTNSLATVKPSAAACWDSDQNKCSAEDVVAGSTKKYWFNLPSKGLVQRSPNSFKREDGRGRTLAPPGLLACAAPEVAAQWHPTKNGAMKPASITTGTNRKYWWLCGAGPDHEWEASPNTRVCRGKGCPYCSGHKVSVTNSLAILAPELATQWHPTKNSPLLPEGVTSGTHKKYWWQCDAGFDHEWEATPASRVGKSTGCPYCSGHKVSLTNNLAILAPEVANKWHPIKNGCVTPAVVASQSNKKYWWLCEKGPDHEWEASPGSRVGNGTGCPCCSGHKMSVTNSLATLAPKVAAQWHPTGNGVVTPAGVSSPTSKKYWWRCDVGPDHEWKASPASRVGQGSGCPSCTHRQLSVTNNPILAKLSYMF